MRYPKFTPDSCTYRLQHLNNTNVCSHRVSKKVDEDYKVRNKIILRWKEESGYGKTDGNGISLGRHLVQLQRIISFYSFLLVQPVIRRGKYSMKRKKDVLKFVYMLFAYNFRKQYDVRFFNSIFHLT